MGHKKDRQVNHNGGTIFAAISIFIVCAFGSALIAYYQRDNIERLAGFFRWLQRPNTAVSFQHPVSLKHDPILPRSIDPERLFKPEVSLRNAAFSQVDTFAQTDFCALLRPAFPDLKLAWQQNALFGDTSECTGEVGASSSGSSETAPDSLFIQLRRNNFGASISVRLKLVVATAAKGQNYVEEFERAAGLVISHIFTKDAPEIMAKVEARNKFSLEIRGVSLKFFEETLMPGAFNLIIEARCDRFQCQARNSYYKLSQSVEDIPPAPALRTDASPQ